MDLKSEKSQEKNDNSDNKYPLWSESQEVIAEIISGMPDIDQCIVNELRLAHEQSSFLASTQTSLKNVPTNPTEFVNIAESFVRRIIKVAKNIEFFKMVCKEDQIALLKGAVVEIMMLRSAINYDINSETWSLSTMKCLSKGSSTTTSPVGSSAASPAQLIPSSPASQTSPAHIPTSPASQIGSPSPLVSIPSPSSNDQFPADVTSFDQLRKLAEKSGMNIDSFRSMARNSNMNIDQLRAMAKNSNLNIDQLRAMAKTSQTSVNTSSDTDKQTMGSSECKQSTSEVLDNKTQSQTAMSQSSMRDKVQGMLTSSGVDIEGLRNMARAAGLDVDKIRKAMFGSESDNSKDSAGVISADILKGNLETQTMFLTYSKFIKSLMHTIHGDLLVLKLLIMLSLFSADRTGIKEHDKIQQIQECYAGILQKYVQRRFPEQKTMFARIIMKLTDLRNINEVHTKMLLKMKLDNIEPLLLEIFDLQG